MARAARRADDGARGGVSHVTWRLREVTSYSQRTLQQVKEAFECSAEGPSLQPADHSLNIWSDNLKKTSASRSRASLSLFWRSASAQEQELKLKQ